MKLEDVVIEGMFLGLPNIDACIGHYMYRRPPIFKYTDIDTEVEEILKEAEALEKGELKLDWERIKEEVKKLKAEYTGNEIPGPWEFDFEL